MTDDLKNFEKAPEADTPQTEDPTTLEMPTDDLEADIEPGKPDDDFERMLAQAGALTHAAAREADQAVELPAALGDLIDELFVQTDVLVPRVGDIGHGWCRKEGE